MSEVLEGLSSRITSRKNNPAPQSYTAKLFAAGRIEIAKKVGEEAIEVIIDVQNESDARLISESADLIYHLLVLLAERGIEWRAVEAELERRRK
jgi:phosphoribosyl-ATP pyrophosphohydrolase